MYKRYINTHIIIIIIIIKHPVVLPKEEHSSLLLAKSFHEATNHQGRGFTLNEVRSSGYWIIGCSGLISKLIHNCTTCKRLRAATQEQKMADLPKTGWLLLHHSHTVA